MSMPSLTNATPPPILAEMQAMKEQMEVMMNALKGRVSNDLDDLVKRTDPTMGQILISPKEDGPNHGLNY